MKQISRTFTKNYVCNLPALETCTLRFYSTKDNAGAKTDKNDPVKPADKKVQEAIIKALSSDHLPVVLADQNPTQHVIVKPESKPQNLAIKTEIKPQNLAIKTEIKPQNIAIKTEIKMQPPLVKTEINLLEKGFKNINKSMPNKKQNLWQNILKNNAKTNKEILFKPVDHQQLAIKLAETEIKAYELLKKAVVKSAQFIKINEVDETCKNVKDIVQKQRAQLLLSKEKPGKHEDFCKKVKDDKKAAKKSSSACDDGGKKGGGDGKKDGDDGKDCKDDGKSGKDDKNGSDGGCNCTETYGSPSCCAAHPIGAKGRHKFTAEIENQINCQIEAELTAGYAYLSMSSFFGNTQVSLPNVSKFYWSMHEEEMEHAKMFIDYQNLRGGIVKLKPLKVPEVDANWGCVTKSLEVSLAMEKLVKEKLLQLHDLAVQCNDIGLSDLVAGTFIRDQDASIREFTELLVRAVKFGKCPCTEHLFDEYIAKYIKKTNK